MYDFYGKKNGSKPLYHCKKISGKTTSEMQGSPDGKMGIRRKETTLKPAHFCLPFINQTCESISTMLNRINSVIGNPFPFIGQKGKGDMFSGNFFAYSLKNFCTHKLPVHPGNIRPGDQLRAFRFAGIGIGAVTKAQFIHLCNHGLYPLFCFNLALG
jgi:hypothetical protein